MILTLTKTMSESNTGLINNKAKIAESSSAEKATNSKESTGNANVIISVSTGALINYIATVIILFVILIVTAYVLVKYLKRNF